MPKPRRGSFRIEELRREGLMQSGSEPRLGQIAEALVLKRGTGDAAAGGADTRCRQPGRDLRIPNPSRLPGGPAAQAESGRGLW
jgi:hypothetical protein